MGSILRMGILGRLSAAFGFVLLLMLGLTVFSVGQVGGISRNLQTINEVNSVKQRHAINFRGSVHDRAIAVRDVVLVTTPGELQTEVALIDKLAKAYADNEVQLTTMLGGRSDTAADERAIATEIAGIQAKTNPLVAEIIALVQNGNKPRPKPF